MSDRELRRLREHATSADHVELLGHGVFCIPTSKRRTRSRPRFANRELHRLREHLGGGLGVFSEPKQPRRAKMRASTMFRHRPPRVHSVHYQATIPDFVGPPGPHATGRADERISVGVKDTKEFKETRDHCES